MLFIQVYALRRNYNHLVGNLCLGVGGIVGRGVTYLLGEKCRECRFQGCSWTGQVSEAVFSFFCLEDEDMECFLGCLGGASLFWINLALTKKWAGQIDTNMHSRTHLCMHARMHAYI